MKSALNVNMQNEWLVRNIVMTVQGKHFNGLSVINYGLLALFRDIGMHMNHAFEKAEMKRYRSRIRESIAAILAPQFGPYFDVENIKLMEKFARKFSSEEISQLSLYVSWKYIPIFIQLKTQEERFFYTRLIHQEWLSPDQLRQKISEKLFEKFKPITGNSDYPLLDLFRFKEGDRDAAGFKEYFIGPTAEAFRQLFEPKAIALIELNQRFTAGYGKDTLKAIHSKILNFQLKYNNWLNIYINLSFRDIGRLVSLSLAESEGIGTKQRLTAIGKRVEQKLGRFFCEEWFCACLKFYDQYQSDGEGTELARLIRWEHIKLLLSIENKEAQLFYARCVLEEGLTVKRLGELIEEDFYNKQVTGQSLDFHDFVQLHITVQKKPIGRRHKPGNDINRNIFKNPDILAFFKAI